MSGDDLLCLEGVEVHFPIRAGSVAPERVVGRSTGSTCRSVEGGPRTRWRVRLGKTTTGRVISKLTRQTKGRIFFEGEDLSTSGAGVVDVSPADRGDLPGSYETLNPKQSVYDFVVEPLIVTRSGSRGRTARIG